MADQKVSDLPSLNGADVDAADLLYIVDSSAGTAGSKKITIGQYQLAPVSGGTANGVVYLNASKVLTTGSALTFDGTNFATTGTVTATKLVPTGNVTAGNGMYLPAANTLAWSTNGAEGMRLDASGNLGLGVTPSAWASQPAIQQTGGALWGINAANYEILQNAFYNGTNYIYRNTNLASRYNQNAGVHSWFTAPSGTAGNAITFTQAMTLDASGNLGLGATTISDSRFQIKGASNNTAVFTDGLRVTSNNETVEVKYSWTGIDASSSLIFGTGGTERARITSGGDLLVGTTTYQNKRVTIDGGSSGGVWASCSTSANSVNVTYNSDTTGDNVFEQFYTDGGPNLRGSIDYNRAGGQVRYNTTSDYRLKTFVAKVTGSGQRIDALNPVEFEWKENGNRARGFFAHEFQQVYASSVSGEKDAVDAEGKPVYQAMQASTAEVIADLVAEIQSLRARVAALEAA